jgi:pimeloyl-ACP methyl ester carboxylesterase
MAQDALGLMDALGIARAHIVGASMGGMIGQIIAAQHQERARSLVSIMSSSGDRNLPQGKPSATAVLTAKPPSANDRVALIEFVVKVYRTIGSPGYPAPDPELRAEAERAIDRCHYPVGSLRHLAAILANGSRVELLKTIRKPTLVLHGEDDPLIPVAAGKDTARHVPGAALKIIPGWGHDIPTALIPTLVEAIASHCEHADRAAIA